MGTTAFYALPYPDPTSSVDVPRDIKALADKLELWKNGFTVPNGGIVTGKAGDVTPHTFNSRYTANGKQYDLQFQPVTFTGRTGAGVACYVDGVMAITLAALEDGAALMRFGGIDRSIPFATQARAISVALSNAEGGFVQVVYKAGLFTQAPLGFVTCSSSSQYYGVLGTPWLAASGYYGVNHVERVAGTGNISAHIFAVQMLPGAAAGPVLAAADGERPVRFTCHTASCDNENIPIETLRQENDDAPAICGPCGEPLTDMVLL